MIGLQKDYHPILYYITHRIILMREIQIIIAIVNNHNKIASPVDKAMQIIIFDNLFPIVHNDKIIAAATHLKKSNRFHN